MQGGRAAGLREPGDRPGRSRPRRGEGRRGRPRGRGGPRAARGGAAAPGERLRAEAGRPQAGAA